MYKLVIYLFLYGAFNKALFIGYKFSKKTAHKKAHKPINTL